MTGADVKESLKEAMRYFPQGVTVVAIKGEEGPWGITVSAFTSISLEPPLVLVSIAKGSAFHDGLAASGSFTVSFLADDQRSVSDSFAGRPGAPKMAAFEPRPDGPFVIRGSRAYVHCKKPRVVDAGDHSVFLGEVVEARKLNDKLPLVYYRQQYTTSSPHEGAPIPSDIIW
jgi:flavin reductase (DIM6/NTAB) family NADH-FMN oxidoreductase RutF